MELDPIEEPRFLPEEEVESAFYLHLEVEDRPGVLAQVAKMLGDHGSASRASCRRASARTRGW